MTPDAVLTIIENGVDDIHPLACVANARRVPLGDVLAGVDPEDDDFGGEPVLELPQLREYMHAVNSTVGPEIEEDDLAAQRLDGEAATAGVDPVERRGECGGANGGRGEQVFAGHAENYSGQWS